MFVLLFLCVHWLNIPADGPEIEILELFSGRARLCRLAKALNISAQAHDITYDDSKPRSAFDINESAGYMRLWRVSSTLLSGGEMGQTKQSQGLVQLPIEFAFALTGGLGPFM